MADVGPLSIALGFVSNIGVKHKSTPPSAIQVKNWQKTIGTEEKLDVIRWLENCEQNGDMP